MEHCWREEALGYSLLGAIGNYYQASGNEYAAQLNAIIGSNFFTDIVPDKTPYPYVVVEETKTQQLKRVVKGVNGFPPRTLLVLVSFNTFANDRATADNINELIEATFLETPDPYLTIENRVHLVTDFENRHSFFDYAGNQGWFGIVQLSYLLRKN
jgi:hypothetical protein